MIKRAVRGEAGDVDRLLGNRHSDPDPGEEEAARLSDARPWCWRDGRPIVPLLTDREFASILADETKRIQDDIAWREDEDHSPAVEFRVEIESMNGWPLS